MATMFSDVFDKIDVAIQEVIAGNVSNLMNVLEPLLLSGFTVYLLFLFLSYWNGRFEDSIVDFFKKVIAWILILGFSVNVSGYNQTIMPIVMGLGDGLSHALNGQTNATVLDNMATSMVDIVTKNNDEAKKLPITSVGRYLMIVIYNAIVIISFSVFLVISASYILLAKIFTGILALVGPVFISLGLFPATRQYFTAWINQVVNYSLMLLLMNIVASFMIKIYGEVIDFSNIDYPTTNTF
ncbi:type IV secretion system protein (plasmid) [Moraxella nonliquefaciens]|nr:type IV secretion system protein [Moraxella nonliquefaciens]QPT43568.1 type IV secretion system protein [Moraxella nonliquefaciens]